MACGLCSEFFPSTTAVHGCVEGPHWDNLTKQI